ncbi:ventral expressed homeobox [Rhinichthys klamathensis goyatoka]|uniref:ventral expressed homeobox n=1 Tax=Rhinichthys klamathensis goyatoka TaxID=3034132 RepID=UPI0024B5A3B3|nr:ventral expressed homeobox [Rhinichthys klamathensis goyatoka]
MQMSARLLHKVREELQLIENTASDWRSREQGPDFPHKDAFTVTVLSVLKCILHVLPITSDSCGYTSASESDDVADDSEGESGARRRARTKFTSEQVARLEKSFSKHKYLGATQRRKIAEKLHLSETQVKTWFQNRRMKLKREVQDMRAAEFLVPTFLPPVTSFQHHATSGQRARLYYPARALQQRVHPVLFAPCYF